MSRLVSSYELFSQGILVAWGTGTGRNLLELGNELSLEHSELCVSLIYIENIVVNSQSLYNFNTTLKLLNNFAASPQTSSLEHPNSRLEDENSPLLSEQDLFTPG
jgi:hypothetical protein